MRRSIVGLSVSLVLALVASGNAWAAPNEVHPPAVHVAEVAPAPSVRPASAPAAHVAPAFTAHAAPSAAAPHAAPAFTPHAAPGAAVPHAAPGAAVLHAAPSAAAAHPAPSASAAQPAPSAAPATLRVPKVDPYLGFKIAPTLPKTKEEQKATVVTYLMTDDTAHQSPQSLGMLAMMKASTPKGIHSVVFRDGAEQGDSRIFYLRPQGDTSVASGESPLAPGVTEVQSNHPAVLGQVVKYALDNYQSKSRYLQIYTHGGGVSGIGTDSNQTDSRATASRGGRSSRSRSSAMRSARTSRAASSTPSTSAPA